MKKTYNVRDIMNRAWDIRKTAAAEIGCKVGEVVMGECLRLAWAEAEGVNAEGNALEIVKEWADMADADKVRMMAACVRKAAKNEIGYSTEDHYLQFSEVPAFGCYRPHDFDEFVNETCIRVLSRLADVDKLTATNERRAAQGKRPLRLGPWFTMRRGRPLRRCTMPTANTARRMTGRSRTARATRRATWRRVAATPPRTPKRRRLSGQTWNGCGTGWTRSESKFWRW